MKLFFLVTPKSILLFLLLTLPTTQRSTADFFRDPRSIPPSLNATAGAWDTFLRFSGSRVGQRVDGLSRLKSYFHYFGYIAAENFSDDFDDSLESAIRLYQQNFRLDVTGELDNRTLRYIVRPRCGVADIINGTNTMADQTTPSLKAVAHYSFIQGQPRWSLHKSTLTYAFRPENQLSESVKRVFRCAFVRWATVIPLNFTETGNYNEADVTIAFFSREHGDGEAFDSVLGTLAHAFPPTNGRFHLDNDEMWVVDGDVTKSKLATAVDLETVAVHEIGHILGLDHSSVEDAIMYPTIQTRRKKVKLAGDDVEGIQGLYGSNPNYNAAKAQFDLVCGAGNGGRKDGRLWGLAVAMVFVFLHLF